jgi:hypothetical protein
VSTLASDPGFWAWLVVLAILAAVLILLSINLSPRAPGDQRTDPATSETGTDVGATPGPDAPPAGVPRLTFGDLRLARAMVVADVLGARTLEGCDRATALLQEWLAAFDDDEEMRIYGHQVGRVRAALLVAEDGQRAADREPQPSGDPGVKARDVQAPAVPPGPSG